jgi:hypothetical protein
MKNLKNLMVLALLFYLVSCSGGTIEKVTQEQVTILVDGSLGPPAQFGLQQFLSVLDQKGVPYIQKKSADENSRSLLFLGTLSGSETIGSLREQKRLDLSETKESLAVQRLDNEEQQILYVASSDDRGLMYALLEIAEQVKHLEPGQDWFDSIKETSEKPHVPVRSMAILLHSEDCEKDWYYSKEHWQEYFAMLATNRWNVFNLIFSHQTPYLSPLYAFHVKVEKHPEIKAKGLTEEQRIKNLDMLRYISSLAKQRGIDFTIGIWQQIAWEGKHQGSSQESMVTGLTRENMNSYTYNALLNLLQECPDIQGVQLRINHESGIDYDEQTEFFRDSVFKAIKDCGRPIQLETRNVGLLRETLNAALDMDLPTRVSHKYWGEHMVFPYHPTRIMWTYSYGDWLKYPQRWENLYQVWSLGSHRLLLWGDPEYVRRFAPTTTFQNAKGFELCAPLSQKGYGNPPGNWRIFRDKDREHYKWEYERYWGYYSLFGRLTYNPDESDEIWLREMRARFGKQAAPAVAGAYQAASRVLPLIMGTATPDYNMYTWAEKDSGGLINFYLHYYSYDPLRIANFMEFIDNVIEGNFSAKNTSEDMARRLEKTAKEIETYLEEADVHVVESNKEYWATKKDFQILAGMARFFSQKIRATYKMGFFYKSGDYASLKQAIIHGEKALGIWKSLAAVGEEIYHPNLVMGPGSYGHWKDNIFFVENDLEQLLHQEELFRMVQDFDFGFDFGPKAYTDVTEIYTPYYTNYYTIEHRFLGVHPHSLFNPQTGFGWNSEVDLKAEQPPKIPRTVWRASNLENKDIPSRALLSDFVQGNESAVFRIDLPEGHYQATIIITDQTPNPADHGPMNVSVIERFGERLVLNDLVVKKGDMVIKRFNFNMVGSRYSNFRLKFSAEPGADFILNGLTFTRIEPHIAHVPHRITSPGQDIQIQATVTLPPQVLMPVKNSLSIARGTTSTIEPPDKIVNVDLFYSTDNGSSFQKSPMQKSDDFIYSITLPGESVQEGEVLYYIEAADSIGQLIHEPPHESGKDFFQIYVTSDREPPRFVHDRVKEWDPGKPLEVKVKVSDESGIDRVLLYYRPTRQTMQFLVETMTQTEGGYYSAKIPGEIFTTEFDLIYFFEAVDKFGNGIFYPDQDKEDPLIVVKIRR